MLDRVLADDACAGAELLRGVPGSIEAAPTLKILLDCLISCLVEMRPVAVSRQPAVDFYDDVLLGSTSAPHDPVVT
jgi:hypothetical protein